MLHVLVQPDQPDQDASHNYIGHNYMVHNYIGHNYMVHNYIGHDYIDHDYIGTGATRLGAAGPARPGRELAVHGARASIADLLDIPSPQTQTGPPPSKRQGRKAEPIANTHSMDMRAGAAAYSRGHNYMGHN